MSDREMFFREEIILCTDFRTEPPECPKCKGTRLVVYGNLTFPHREVWEEGKRVEEQTDHEIAKPFEVTTVECLSCQVRFILHEEENFMLMKTNSELTEKVNKLSGKASSIC
jgi:hypothetical protein